MRSAFQNIFKHWTVTLPTVLVLALVLTMFHALLGVRMEAERAISDIQKKFSLTVYLKDSADPFEIGNLITELEKRSDVRAPVLYTSKEEAWKIMSASFSLDTDLLKQYRFSLPASLTLTPKNPKNAAAIQSWMADHAQNLLRQETGLQQKNITTQMIDFLERIERGALRTILFFLLLFVTGGMLLIASTIHMAVTARHREISIMKLVGASFQKITLPFVCEGFLLGIIAYLLHLLFLTALPLPVSLLQSKLHWNALLLELLAVTALSSAVSFVTARYSIHR